jgi:hypothetical protein
MVSRYEQLSPSPQFRLGSSSINSSDGIGVSWPLARATTWSTVIPSWAFAPVLANAPLRKAAADRL